MLRAPCRTCRRVPSIGPGVVLHMKPRCARARLFYHAATGGEARRGGARPPLLPPRILKVAGRWFVAATFPITCRTIDTGVQVANTQRRAGQPAPRTWSPSASFSTSCHSPAHSRSPHALICSLIASSRPRPSPGPCSPAPSPPASLPLAATRPGETRLQDWPGARDHHYGYSLGSGSTRPTASAPTLAALALGRAHLPTTATERTAHCALLGIL
jgi:hypothetical protein